MIGRLTSRAFYITIKKFDKLENMWSRIKEDPTEYAYTFECATSHMRPSNRMFYKQVWKDYYYHYPYGKAQFENNIRHKKDMEVHENDPEIDSEALNQAKGNSSDSTTHFYHYRFTKTERLDIAHHLVVLVNGID